MAFIYWAHLPEHTDMFTQGYIGFTSGTVEKRWNQHNCDSKRYPHLTFYKAMAKYGDAIILETILEGDIEYCLDIENKLRPANKIGWNIKVVGDLGSLGVIPSDETRLKMSESKSGEKNHFFGKTHTDEMKAKMSAERKGRKPSEEARAKMSASRLGEKMNLSPEQRAKRSANSKAKRNSPETRAKISAARAGMKMSAEVCAAKSQRLRDNPWSGARANKSLWMQAASIFDHKNDGVSRDKAAKLLGVVGGQLATIWRKLKGGWNPKIDPFWLAFQEQYNEKDQHATSSTQTA